MNHTLIKIIPATTILWLGLLSACCSNTHNSQNKEINPVLAENFNDGMPYGPITDQDIEELSQFAGTHDLDLNAEMRKVYEKDSDALARFLKFSLAITSFDKNARAYGQLLYSCFLNMGESKDWNFFSVLVVQEPNVQQRIRDYLNYPLNRLPKNEREMMIKEIRGKLPLLYPDDYQFGRNNPIFRNR